MPGLVQATTPHMQRALDTKTEYCASPRIALPEAAAVGYRTRSRLGPGFIMMGPRMLLQINRVGWWLMKCSSRVEREEEGWVLHKLCKDVFLLFEIFRS